MIAIFIALSLNDFGDELRKIHGIIQQAKFNEYFVWYQGLSITKTIS